MAKLMLSANTHMSSPTRGPTHTHTHTYTAHTITHHQKSGDTFITAVEHAVKFDRKPLIAKAYRWLKRNGARMQSASHKTRTSTQAALDVAVGVGDDVGSPAGHPLLFDASTEEFVCGGKRLASSVFDEFITEEVRLRSYFLNTHQALVIACDLLPCLPSRPLPPFCKRVRSLVSRIVRTATSIIYII